MSRYQTGKTNLDFTEARDSEWQWHQLGHMQVCISLQTDNHASTPPVSFLQARCPSCRPTNSVKALKAKYQENVALPTFARHTPLMLSAAQQSIGIFCQLGPQQQTFSSEFAAVCPCCDRLTGREINDPSDRHPIIA